MKRKRLNRDAWGFQFFPYYQMRIDCDDFHGMACLIRMVEGDYQYWDMPQSGITAICGEGMTWMELIPDGKKRVITVKYFKDGFVDEGRKNYPSWARENMCPSVWYVDITDGIEYDKDGVIIYIDKYLDIIFSPEGDISISDRDELDAAYESGELSRQQYEEALVEGEAIQEELCGNIEETTKRCARIRRIMEEQIANGCKPMYLSAARN